MEDQAQSSRLAQPVEVLVQSKRPTPTQKAEEFLKSTSKPRLPKYLLLLLGVLITLLLVLGGVYLKKLQEPFSIEFNSNISGIKFGISDSNLHRSVLENFHYKYGETELAVMGDGLDNPKEHIKPKKISVIYTEGVQPYHKVYDEINDRIASSYNQKYNSKTGVMELEIQIAPDSIDQNATLHRAEIKYISVMYELANYYPKKTSIQRQEEWTKFLIEYIKKREENGSFLEITQDKKVYFWPRLVKTVHAQSCNGNYTCGDYVLKCTVNGLTCSPEGSECGPIESPGICTERCEGDHAKPCSIFGLQASCENGTGPCDPWMCMINYSCWWNEPGPTNTPVPTPSGGSCDNSCGVCGFRDTGGNCGTDWGCCHRVCSGPSCITVFGPGSDACDEATEEEDCGDSPTPTTTPQKDCSVSIEKTTFDTSETPEVGLSGTSFHTEDDRVRLWLEEFSGGGQISPLPQYVFSGLVGLVDTSEEWYAPFYYYKLPEITCLSKNDVSCSDSGWISIRRPGSYCLHCDISADPGRCSGNPQCTYEGGTEDCGTFVSCSDNDNVCFTVITPTPMPTNTPIPTPTSIPSCDVDFVLTSSTVLVGDSTTGECRVTNINHGSVDQVDFSSTNPPVATVLPLTDTTSPYWTTVSCQPGDGGLSAVGCKALMDDVVRDSDFDLLTCITPTPTACPTLSPPTGLDGKCPAPGTTGEVSWDLVAGATDYAIRVDNLADPWDSSCSAVDGPGDFCLNLPGISKDFISAQGATYGWWVHAINVCGWSDPAYGSNFSCPTPTPTPYCVMTGISYDDELLTGDSEQMNTTWNANGPMTYVDFTAVTNPDRLNICPWSDASCSLIPGDPSEHVDTGAPPWGVRYTGLDAGDPTAPITIEIQGYMDSWGGAFCPLVTRAINVRNVPWWQVGFGDVFTNDDLISKIPNSCVDSCIDDLISGVDTNGDGTFEMPAQGAALYSEVTNFTSGTVSSLGMIVDMDGQKLDVSRYTYEYFTDSIPGFSGLTVSAQDSLDQSETLNEGNVNSVNSGGNAYDVIVRNADTEIDAGGGIIDIGSEKIILFVNGTLTINSDINLNKGVGFFMAIVNGDIIIDPSVGDQYLWTTIDPELEGIYVTTSDGGDFKTGTSGVDSDVTLEVRGIVAAVGGAVELERDLVDDDTTPAEKFYYAPDQTLLLPDFFGQRVYRWKEVAP